MNSDMADERAPYSCTHSRIEILADTKTKNSEIALEFSDLQVAADYITNKIKTTIRPQTARIRHFVAEYCRRRDYRVNIRMRIDYCWGSRMKCDLFQLRMPAPTGSALRGAGPGHQWHHLRNNQRRRGPYNARTPGCRSGPVCGGRGCFWQGGSRRQDSRQGFTGTMGVFFNGTAATFNVRSATYLTATLPVGARNDQESPGAPS